MNPAGGISRSGTVATILCLCLAATAAFAGDLRIRMLDSEGGPVPEVVVHLEALDPAAGTGAMPAAGATMNQQDLAFDPHVLVVRTGTRIDFPNNDDVRHHVYSFSPAMRFNFSVDSGTVRESLEFAEPGIVTLGCNIHDGMLGYIVVVDTPYFTKTDGQGVAEFSSLPPGRYEVSIWTPRARPKDLPEPVVLAVSPGETASFEHRFDRLYAPHQHSETSLKWGY